MKTNICYDKKGHRIKNYDLKKKIVSELPVLSITLKKKKEYKVQRLYQGKADQFSQNETTTMFNYLLQKKIQTLSV